MNDDKVIKTSETTKAERNEKTKAANKAGQIPAAGESK